MALSETSFGQTRGNPSGRSKSKTSQLRSEMREAVTNGLYTDLDRLVEKFKELAMNGDMQAAKLLFEYGIGRPVQLRDDEETEINAAGLSHLGTLLAWLGKHLSSEKIEEIQSVCTEQMANDE